MPLYDTTSPTTQYTSSNAGVIPNDVFGVALDWFINRTPLLSRLPKLPTGSPNFLLTNDNYRPRSRALTGSYTTGSSTVLTFDDASWLTVGDVVEVESEQFLVTAAHATTPTVTGAYAGTSGANHSSGVTAYLITNTRTGAEVDVSAISRTPSPVTQYCQTIQHAYQVGGAMQANDNYVSGLGTPLDRDRMLALQHCMDDFEEAAYYGRGVALAAATTKPAMKGLRTLCSTNNTTSPTNASAYKPSDLVRDTTQKCLDNGGNPTILFVATNFHTGFSVWGHPLMRLNAGDNAFGTPIDMFEAPFLSGLSIVPCPLLRAGTAFCVSEAEIRIRMKRDLFEKPRGSRGDAIEGDYIMEGAIELDNEYHHAWVEGITGWAAA